MMPASNRYYSRRQFLAASAAAIASCTQDFGGLFGDAAQAAAADGQRLRDLAAAKGLLFGASFAVHELDRPHGARYADIYERDAHILTSELEFKLSALRPTPDKLDFSHADRLVAFALQRQMLVRGHTLIWNDDLPEWIKRLGNSQIEHLLESHILSVLERFRDKVSTWDVVNEPIAPWDQKPGNLRDGPFYAALGEGYIAKSFRLAREFAPKAKLVLNEASTETNDEPGETFRNSLYDLAVSLKDQGVPVDAIGLQSHLKVAAAYDYPKIIAFLHKLAALGYEIHITELDVNDTGVSGPISARDAAVAGMYKNYLDAVLSVPAVKVVQLWQLADATSWMRDPAISQRMGVRYKPRPLLYDEAFRRKPAWDAVARALSGALIR